MGYEPKENLKLADVTVGENGSAESSAGSQTSAFALLFQALFSFRFTRVRGLPFLHGVSGCSVSLC